MFAILFCIYVLLWPLCVSSDSVHFIGTLGIAPLFQDLKEKGP